MNSLLFCSKMNIQEYQKERMNIYFKLKSNRVVIGISENDISLNYVLEKNNNCITIAQKGDYQIVIGNNRAIFAYKGKGKRITLEEANSLVEKIIGRKNVKRLNGILENWCDKKIEKYRK